MAEKNAHERTDAGSFTLDIKPGSSRSRSSQAIEEIAETIGVRLARRLVEVFGGEEVKFPVRPHDDHRIIVALGKEDGYAICSYMGGSQISVPHCLPRKNARADITALEAKGLSRAEIARELGLTQRYVRRLANEKASDRMDLFRG